MTEGHPATWREWHEVHGERRPPTGDCVGFTGLNTVATERPSASGDLGRTNRYDWLPLISWTLTTRPATSTMRRQHVMLAVHF